MAPFKIEAPEILKRNIRGGMYYLINFIDTEILRYETGTNTAEINTRMVKAPTPDYKTSTVYDNISGNMHNLIVFPLVVLFLRFIYNILFEKENKIAQNLRNMGMSMYQFYFSWWVFYTILVFIYSVFWTVVTKRAMAPDANILLYFLYYFLTGEYLLCLAIFLSSFFSTAKPGVLSAIISFFVLFGVGVAKGAISGANLSTNTWLALSPFAGLQGACDAMLLVQSFYQPFGFSLFSETILQFKYSIWFWITLIKSIVFYFVGIYLDQVWPKDTGVAKHPFFCFVKSSKTKPVYNQVSDISIAKDGVKN